MSNIDSLKDKRLIAPDRNNKEAILEEEIGRGGEGIIYTIKGYPNAVAKIYYEDKRDTDREEKLKLLIKKFSTANIPQSFIREIAVPITRLYDKDKFVGYVMRKVNGKPLKIVMAGDKRLKVYFPNATRLDLVLLCIDFLKKIDFLHSLNILIGDINLNNVLVDSKDLTKCYLVDMDTVQVDNLPCPVGTDEFTPPNLQGKNFKDILRTKEDEYFSIAIMLFMILMIGKHPYSRQDGSSPTENIKNHKFPYLVNGFKKLHENAPKGYYKNVWTHFPKKLREYFYDTFANDKRFSPKEWIKVLHEYADFIKKGKSTNELAPISFAVWKNPVNVVCENCGLNFLMEESYLNYLKNKKYKILCNKCYDILYGINLAKNQIVKNSNSSEPTKRTIRTNKFKTTNTSYTNTASYKNLNSTSKYYYNKSSSQNTNTSNIHNRQNNSIKKALLKFSAFLSIVSIIVFFISKGIINFFFGLFLMFLVFGIFNY